MVRVNFSFFHSVCHLIAKIPWNQRIYVVLKYTVYILTNFSTIESKFLVFSTLCTVIKSIIELNFFRNDASEALFLEYISDDGKMTPFELRQFFASLHGSYYFTEEFFQEFFIKKGDKDGDGLLSLEELANTKFDLKNSKLCQKQRSTDGVFEKIKKLIYKKWKIRNKRKIKIFVEI